ncbi:MAG: hypothetical protein RAO94_07455 [Candidatus Stygibacter australis]|nr:hypothetical protein [Candidatus Stygibacter australis]MDP8322169.1 hypothetical protein [Candidatus Stygibacter australis]
MKKIKALKVVNIFMVLAFLVTALSLVFYKMIPSAIQGEEFLYEMHELAGTIFILVGIIHLILNFGWIKSMYFKKKKM